MNVSQDYELTRLDKLRNYQAVLTEVKSLVNEIDPKVKVIFFASVLREDYSESSDIDIIVIPSNMKLKDRITLAVWKSIDDLI